MDTDKKYLCFRASVTPEMISEAIKKAYPEHKKVLRDTVVRQI